MNWNLPTLTSLYTDVIDLMKERTEDVATMFRSSSSTNIPNDSIRWSDLNSRLESWNGSAWVELDSLYEMKVRDSVNAEIGTKLATARTIAISGDATGSTTFDGTANKTISLSLTASQLLAKLKTVDGVGSGLDADLLDGINSDGFVKTDFSTSSLRIGDSTDNVNADIVTENAITYTTTNVGSATDGALYSQAYNTNWVHQIAGDYRTGDTYVRGMNLGVWQPWRKQWNSGNDGSGSGLDADLLDGKHATSFNQVIGTDSDINTSGATIPDRFYFTDGVCTSHGTRTLTAADLGALADSAHSFGASSGYQKLSNGMIMQWGDTGDNNALHTAVITFPIAFPTACTTVVVTGRADGNWIVHTKGTTTFQYNDAGVAGAHGVYWFAIGY